MSAKKIILSTLLLLIIAVSMSAISAQDASADTLSADIAVSGNTTADITDAINKASDGDTINLGTNKAYNMNNDSITISKKVNIKGDNVTITAGSSNYAFQIKTSDIEISGITFKNPVELPSYGDRTFTGKAIHTTGASNILIKNCKFENYSYGIEFSSTRQSTIENCWFNGATTLVEGTAGEGTKAIQLMGSDNINIINNTIYGHVYDGLSIAS